MKQFNPHVEEQMARTLEHFESKPLDEVGQMVRHLRLRFVAAREVYAAKTRGRAVNLTNALVAASGPVLDFVEGPEVIDEARKRVEAEEIFARVHPEKAKAREIHQRVHGMSVADYKRRRANEKATEEIRIAEATKAKRKKSDSERAEIRKAHGPNYAGTPARWETLDVPPATHVVDSDGNLRAVDGRLLQAGTRGD